MMMMNTYGGGGDSEPRTLYVGNLDAQVTHWDRNGGTAILFIGLVLYLRCYISLGAIQMDY